MTKTSLPPTALNRIGLGEGSIGRALFDQGNAPCIVTNKGGEILAVNRAAAERLGWQAAELNGLFLSKFMADGREISALLDNTENTNGRHFCALYRMRDGGTQAFETNILPVADSERPENPDIYLLFLTGTGAETESVHEQDGEHRRSLALVAAKTRSLVIASDTRGEPASLNQHLERLVWERTEKLRESEALFRRVSELSHAGIFQTDLDGSCTLVNKAWLTLTGVEQEGAIGMNWTGILDPLDRERVTEAWRQCVASDLTFRDEFRIDRRNGRSFWVVGRIGPERNSAGELTGFVGTIVDIDRLKQGEARQRTREQYLTTVLDNLADAVITIDQEGIIGSANPSVKRIFGYDPAELVGQNVSILAGGVHAARHDDYLENYHNTDTPRILGVNARQLEGRKKDGGELAVELTVVKLDEPVGGQHYIGFIRDVSERVKREDQLRELQKMEVVGQISGGVAHDFNNLLGIIVGCLDLVIPDLEDRPAEAALLEKAVNAAERGGNLTQRLLSFSRQQSLLPQLVNINRLFDDLSPLLRSSIDKSISIDMNLAVSCWDCKIDPTQLESAIINLALNAQDAMPEGGMLSIKTSNACLDQGDMSDMKGIIPGDYVLISVTDTGCGMTPDALEHCFQPFYTTKERNHATGLGLSMVQGFVAQSGGKIHINSGLGAGTTICLYLPRFDEETGTEDQSVPAPGEPAAPLKKLILIVDDDDMMREFSTVAIRNLEYRTVSAEDGSRALDILRGNPDIDLVFSDIFMPGGMNGVEMTIAAKELRPDIRILLTSSYSGDTMTSEGTLNQGDEIIEKPYRISDLTKRLSRLLEGPEQ